MQSNSRVLILLSLVLSNDTYENIHYFTRIFQSLQKISHYLQKFSRLQEELIYLTSLIQTFVHPEML